MTTTSPSEEQLRNYKLARAYWDWLFLEQKLKRELNMKKALKKPVVKKSAIVSPLTVGNKVFIRAVTYHYLGAVVAITPTEVILDQASWVAVGGRFNLFLSEGVQSSAEIERYPGLVSVQKAAIVDACEWLHPLPVVSV